MFASKLSNVPIPLLWGGIHLQRTNRRRLSTATV